MSFKLVMLVGDYKDLHFSMICAAALDRGLLLLTGIVGAVRAVNPFILVRAHKVEPPPPRMVELSGELGLKGFGLPMALIKFSIWSAMGLMELRKSP